MSYSYDGAAPLGTGGALRKAIVGCRLAGPVFVLYGDSYLTVTLDDVIAQFVSSNLPALMVVYANYGHGDASNAAFMTGSSDTRRQSPTQAAAGLTMIDYGLSIFDASIVVDRVPSAQRCDLADLQQSLSSQELMAGFEATKRFYEIGSPGGLADLERHLAGLTASG